MIEPPKELIGFLEPYSRGIQELTLALRDLVIEEMAPCCEYILEVYCISILYGPTHRLKDGICYIVVWTNHVNLSFNRGTELSDPQKLLEGDGKRSRHIKIRSLADLNRPAIRAYLQEACERAGHDVTGAKPKTVVTVVKAKSSARRLIG